MTKVTTSHHTVVVRRSYDFPVSEVFRAWQDPKALAIWHGPGDHTWTMKVLEHDFIVGGRRRFVFGASGEPPYHEDCRYEDIVPEQRICYAMTVAHKDVRITCSMVTIEFHAKGGKTDLVATDQLAILDGGDTAADRERGWGETLGKLAPYLSANASSRSAAE